MLPCIKMKNKSAFHRRLIDDNIDATSTLTSNCVVLPLCAQGVVDRRLPPICSRPMARSRDRIKHSRRDTNGHKEKSGKHKKSSHEAHGPKATTDKEKERRFSDIVKGVANGLDHKSLFAVASGLYKTRMLQAFVAGRVKRVGDDKETIDAMEMRHFL